MSRYWPPIAACVFSLGLLFSQTEVRAAWPTDGGAGGREIVVTSLAESGAGTLREALDAEGPRTIKFAVGGEIWLSDTFFIRNPFVTIAGETAPSPGITLLGDRVKIRSHDVILRHIRIRVGARKSGSNPVNRDALEVDGSPDGKEPSHNVLVENCSFSWAVDETVQSWNPNNHDIVFRRCLIAEGLRHSIHPTGPRSIGMVIGPSIRNVLVQENLFVSNAFRNIGIWGGSSVVMLNNVIYNPGNGAIQLMPGDPPKPVEVSIIGNVILAGPDTQPELRLFGPGGVSPESRVYLADNRASGTKALEETEIPAGLAGGSAAPLAAKPPVPLPQGTVVLKPDAVLPGVLRQAGARPADRDATDRRLIEEVQSGKGSLKDSPLDSRLQTEPDAR
ncbi:MAG: hypothetical protein PHQ12_00725 [Chthoniobacteraceae bacterium]|nr:hypothetical protein [Chthoniobacteraceae bacterium]